MSPDWDAEGVAVVGAGESERRGIGGLTCWGVSRILSVTLWLSPNMEDADFSLSWPLVPFEEEEENRISKRSLIL